MVSGRPSATRRERGPVLSALLLGLALLSSCAGGGGGMPPPPSDSGGDGGGGMPPPSSGSGGDGTDAGGDGSTAVLVNLGEFASVPDNVVSFELIMDSVSLRSASGGDVPLLSHPRRLELSALKARPLLLSHVAQGNYGGVVIGVSNLVISYVDSSGILHEKVPASLSSSTATNASQFSIGPAPMELFIHPFFGIGPVGGSALAVTPALNFTSTFHRPTKDLVGRVIRTGSQSIWLDLDGLPPTVDPSSVDGAFSFATNSSTELQGLDALGELTAGMTVEVDAVLDSGGTLRATRLKLEDDDASKVVVEGLTLSTSLARLRMSVREVHGPFGVSRPEVGAALTVEADATTQFHLEPDDVDLSHLDFTPDFDVLAIAPGQNVRAAASSGSATTITADWLELEKQSVDGLAGTVLPGSVSGQFSFPLEVPADSAFARLTGHTSVLVTLQPSTEKFFYFGFEGCVPCLAGGTVRVRGLLFFSGDQYRLVADWLSPI